jgi:hypothetical protein
VAAEPGRIASLVAIGDPAVALPGAAVRMPLSLLTVPVLGNAMLRSPTPRSLYRRLLGAGLSPAAAAGAPDDLVDVLRLAGSTHGQCPNRGLAHACHQRLPERQAGECPQRRGAAPDRYTDGLLLGD